MLLLAGVLALGACNENAGWNPNYALADRPYGEALDSETPYARYKVRREAALTGQAPAPKAVPVALPAKAPTAQDIAGPTLGEIAQGQRQAAAAARPAPVVQRAAVVRPSTVERITTPRPDPVLTGYATRMAHQPGTTVWARAGADYTQAASACRDFVSASAAQTAFITAGGPSADPRGLDPDGDGYVCGWDPRPLRPGL
jgi:hypothetical protein